ncbi:MAG: N-acetyltransferase family protein [Actinomycetota bacterium]
MTDLRTRLARPDDAAATAEIYNAEVLETTVTFDLVPRSVGDQRAWLQQRSGAHAVIVAVDDDDTIAGFASLSPYRDRPAYNTTVENSVYVSRDHRGRGVGRRLLTDLLVIAEDRGFHSVMARIVGGHDRSIALHAAVGFEMVGTEREVGRKFGRWLDIVLMQRLFGESASPRPPMGV